MFRLPTYASVGDVLYPWWLRTMDSEEISSSHAYRAFFSGQHQDPPNLTTSPSTPFRHRGVCSKYRGFRRTLRCLTLDPVVARLVESGPRPVRFRLLCL